jgi:hypothetical protein
MATRLQTRKKDINYLSKDYDAIREDLKTFLQRYFPNTIQDFNDASGGMAIIDSMSFLGDMLSFQIDRQINESFINRAVERKNIIALAEGKGYSVKSVTPAVVDLTISAIFVASISANTVCTLKKGSRVVSSQEPANFEIIEDVNFAKPQNRSSTIDGSNVTYSVTGVKAIAGRSKLFKYNVSNNPPKFLKITLPDRGVTEITSLTAANGDEYFEVDNLARDTVFIGDVNTGTTSADTPYVLRLKRVPRRFVTERESDGRMSVRFGAGINAEEDGDVIPNPEDFVLPSSLRGSPSGFAPAVINSTNFLKTKTLGVVPSNTVLDINYRVGGGVETNVGADVITRFIEKRVDFHVPNIQSNSGNETSLVIAQISCNNPAAAVGGEAAESNASIKENAIGFFNSQGRCVTLQDYKVRALSMPAQFGSVFRAVAKKDPSNNLGVNLMLVSRNASGTLQAASGVLKNNVETYINQFRGMSDTIKISDGKIVNIGINFSIYPVSGVNDKEALIKSIIILQNMFNVRLMDFGFRISRTEIIRNLQNLPEVASVPSLQIVNITGADGDRTYSNISYDIRANTKNDIISFEPDMIPELRFPNFDIQGVIG